MIDFLEADREGVYQDFGSGGTSIYGSIFLDLEVGVIIVAVFDVREDRGVSGESDLYGVLKDEVD